MKRQIVLLSFVMATVLSGCSSSSTAETKKEQLKPQETTTTTPVNLNGDPAIVETTEPPTKHPLEANDPEKVLQLYLEKLIAKKYDELASFIYAENLNSTPEKVISQMKENDFKNSIERTDYMITSIVDYDDTHKLGNIIIRGTSFNGAESANDSLGLILVNGEWKIDLSLIVTSEERNEQITIPNKFITITKITKVTLLDGYQIKVEYRNNLLEKQILVGFINSTAVLTTDKGPIAAQLSKTNVEAQATGSFTIKFATPEKSTAESLEIKGLRIGDSNNLPSLIDEPFNFEVKL